MKRLALTWTLACLPLSGALAQAMPVGQFVAKADALRNSGLMAIFSSDAGLLKAEIIASAKELKEKQKAAVKAGRKPAFCAPDKVKINSDELLAHFRSLTPSQSNLPVRAAFATFMIRKYPCVP